ncbi:Cytidine deaminase [Vigna angularis]|uniref:Cytidine deaminase n=1 Tax=Phaseolus angularis TaxID=3914 RepID=A0A8T0KZ95_PHAAN|nr:Cytidine deaminase [Vigna angularis]
MTFLPLIHFVGGGRLICHQAVIEAGERDQAGQVHVDAVEEGLVGELFFREAPHNGWKFLLTNLVLHGETRLDSFTVFATPWGHCRQFFQELRDALDIQILITSHANPHFTRLSHFLSHLFDPYNFLSKTAPLLLQPRHNALSLPSLIPQNKNLNLMLVVLRSHEIEEESEERNHHGGEAGERELGPQERRQARVLERFGGIREHVDKSCGQNHPSDKGLGTYEQVVVTAEEVAVFSENARKETTLHVGGFDLGYAYRFDGVVDGGGEVLWGLRELKACIRVSVLGLIWGFFWAAAYSGFCLTGQEEKVVRTFAVWMFDDIACDVEKSHTVQVS